jgi:predicted GH43/DUF377 family glycosyl hydrolase
MIKVKKEGIVLEKTVLSFENDSVLNPAIMQEGETIHMFYRAVRAGNYSTIGYCKLSGAKDIVQRNNKPILIPSTEEASNGVEDPRIVKIDGVYYITYTSFDGINALGTLSTSSDLISFTNRGIVVPQFTFDEFKRLAECTNLINPKYFRHVRHFHPSKKVFMWDKDVIFFPRRINGKLAFLHRIRPGIQLVLTTSLDDLTREFWNDYFLHFNEHIILDPVGSHHESSFIGGGCPPIETTEGWLLIYHGVFDTSKGYVYSAAAALLDIDNPIKVIGRLPYPLLFPELDYEKNGIVDNVVFPTGTALFDDRLYIYYGAADKCIACASVSFNELIKELKLNSAVH